MIIDGRTPDGPNSDFDYYNSKPTKYPPQETEITKNLELLDVIAYHQDIIDDAQEMLSGNATKDYEKLCGYYEHIVQKHSKYVETLKKFVNGCFSKEKKRRINVK